MSIVTMAVRHLKSGLKRQLALSTTQCTMIDELFDPVERDLRTHDEHKTSESPHVAIHAEATLMSAA